MDKLYREKRYNDAYLQNPDKEQFVKTNDILRALNEIFAEKELVQDEFMDTTRITEIIEEKIIPEYGWESVQQALFDILLDDSRTEDEYYIAEEVFWGAALDKRKIDTDTAVALLYYRLGDINNPYKENLLWSITAKLKNLDYCSSDYNALKDSNIINILLKYGIKIK